LRAVAAFAVVAHHVGFETGATYRSVFGPILARLDLGVPIFFAISGYLLGSPFIRRLLDGEPISGVPRFWIRRAVRIYPAYWLVLTCIVLFFGVEITSVRDAVLLYGLLQIYDVHTFYLGMVQAWTLCTEISFYAVLPLLAIAARSVFGRLRSIDPVRGLLVGCVGLYVVGFAWRLAMFGFDPSFARIGLFWLPGQIDFFAIGLAIAVLRVKRDRDPRFARMIDTRWMHPAVWWVGAAVAFAIVCSIGLTRTPVVAGAHLEFGSGGDFVRQFLYGVVALCMLVPVALPARTSPATARILGNRSMVMLGVLSYGVYLWHKNLIPKVQSWFGWNQFEGSFLVVFGVVSVLSVALAWITYRLVEAPLLRLAGGGTLRAGVTDPGTAPRPHTDPDPGARGRSAS
jgi:peptidoglycan/LPS O-acetylase OafA/YrhL